MNPDNVWLLISGLLSILSIILYLWGTHRSGFRVLSHFFVGTTCGFFCIVSVNQIIIPWYIDPFVSNFGASDFLLQTIPLVVLSLILIVRFFPINTSIGILLLIFNELVLQ